MRIAAATCSLVLGVGFGLPGVAGAVHLARTGEVWKFLGFPTYGSGPFERWGVPTSVALIAGFVLVCAAELVLGVMILADAPGTKAFSIALMPFEFAYWFGFALPFGRLSASLGPSCSSSNDNPQPPHSSAAIRVVRPIAA